MAQEMLGFTRSADPVAGRHRDARAGQPVEPGRPVPAPLVACTQSRTARAPPEAAGHPTGRLRRSCPPSTPLALPARPATRSTPWPQHRRDRLRARQRRRSSPSSCRPRPARRAKLRPREVRRRHQGRRLDDPRRPHEDAAGQGRRDQDGPDKLRLTRHDQRRHERHRVEHGHRGARQPDLPRRRAWPTRHQASTPASPRPPPPSAAGSLVVSTGTAALGAQVTAGDTGVTGKYTVVISRARARRGADRDGQRRQPSRSAATRHRPPRSTSAARP